MPWLKQELQVKNNNHKLQVLIFCLTNEGTMNKSGIALCVFVAAIAISGASAQSCATCNCQVNNIQLLDQLVEAKVNRILANEPSKCT